MKKRTVSVSGMANPVPSHAMATRAGPFLFMSGQMGLSEKSGRPFQSYEELGGEPPYPALGLLAPNTWEEAFVTQTKTTYDRIATLLREQGSTLQDIVFHSVYLRDMRNFPLLARTRSRLFAGGLACGIDHRGALQWCCLPNQKLGHLHHRPRVNQSAPRTLDHAHQTMGLLVER